VRSASASDFRRSAARRMARVASCVAGVRQSRDCLHPRPLRRPRALRRPPRLFPEIGRVPRAGPRSSSREGSLRHRRECASRRGPSGGASAARRRRDAVVSRRPASASAAPSGSRRRPPALPALASRSSSIRLRPAGGLSFIVSSFWFLISGFLFLACQSTCPPTCPP